VIESPLEEEPAEEVVFDIAGTEGLASDKDSPSDHFEIFRVGLVRKVSLLILPKPQITFEPVCRHYLGMTLVALLA
jgi:hypothetical protein